MGGLEGLAWERQANPGCVQEGSVQRAGAGRVPCGGGTGLQVTVFDGWGGGRRR